MDKKKATEDSVTPPTQASSSNDQISDNKPTQKP